jgi:hypothetical protein
MIHYSCDRCKRTLDPQEDLRYVVKLEVQAVMEPLDIHDEEGDRDHLLEIHEILERLEDDQTDDIGEDIYQRRRYDLCAECYQQFIKNPLAGDVPLHLEFSDN